MSGDSLIAYNLEHLVFFFSYILFLGMVGVVGLVSKKLDYAIFFSIICAAPIVLIALVTHAW